MGATCWPSCVTAHRGGADRIRSRTDDPDRESDPVRHPPDLYAADCVTILPTHGQPASSRFDTSGAKAAIVVGSTVPMDPTEGIEPFATT